MIMFDTGSVSQTIDIFIQDSSSLDGLDSLVYNSAGLSCYYRVGQTGVPAAVALANQTNTGTWVSGGFCAVDTGNMPGVYRFDIPDELLEEASFVHIMLKGAASMVPSLLRLDCRNTERLAGGQIKEFEVVDDFAVPVDGVACWVSLDTGGNQVIQGTKYTNTFGLVDFMLETGEYYLWRQRTGYNFINPTSFDVP